MYQQLFADFFNLWERGYTNKPKNYKSPEQYPIIRIWLPWQKQYEYQKIQEQVCLKHSKQNSIHTVFLYMCWFLKQFYIMHHC